MEYVNTLTYMMTIFSGISTTKKLFVSAALLACAMQAQATEAYIDNISISKIRSVGDYSSELYSNTVEIWFTTPVSVPAGMKCPMLYRVEIDVKQKHLVAAAYLALATGKKIGITIDDRLPIRGDACEVSFLDIMN